MFFCKSWNRPSVPTAVGKCKISVDSILTSISIRWDKSVFEKKLSGETNTDFICAYTVLDRLQQEIIRENHSARQAQKIQQHTIKIRERTDPSHPLIRDWFWTWRASRRHASISCGTVFQTALPLLLVIPRLRPGLLSLRSVLASSQILLFSIMNYALWIMHYEL